MNSPSILNSSNDGLSSLAIPRWKRVVDLAAILLTLPLTIPVGIVIAALIKVLSPGPVLFRQERVGFLGRSFMCLKFRTMVVGADTSGHHNHLSTLMGSDAPMVKLDARGDARIIPFGIFLRSSGLDELPQLVNVLLGEMSLVGPRPCLPYESQQYLPWQRERFNALPGLTGLWQVSGKNKTTFVQMMQMDIDYGRNRTLGMDLLILFKTPLVVIGQLWEVLARKAGFNGRPVQPRAVAPFHHSYPMADVQPARSESQAREISKQA